MYPNQTFQSSGESNQPPSRFKKIRVFIGSQNLVKTGLESTDGLVELPKPHVVGGLNGIVFSGLPS